MARRLDYERAAEVPRALFQGSRPDAGAVECGEIVPSGEGESAAVVADAEIDHSVAAGEAHFSTRRGTVARGVRQRFVDDAAEIVRERHRDREPRRHVERHFEIPFE